MTSDALILAALATAALPGLRPIRAEAVRGRVGERYQVGFVEDAEHRRWVVRLPADAVAAAQQDASVTLLGMLARRLPFALPAPKGFAALKDGRRAMVYPLITGHALSFFALPPGRGLAAELGRALAALHNIDRRLFEEAAVPAYDAEQCRHRHLVLLDRGAQTGSVPVGLLSRWERLLDDVSWWRFAPTPVHGRLDGPHVLASFDSPDDASSGRIRAIVGWEDARVGDPAEDLAALVAQASSETVDTVLEAYAMSRLEHPDSHLEERARLVAELRLVDDLLAATAAKDEPSLVAAVEALHQLDMKTVDPAESTSGERADGESRPGHGDAGRLYRAGSPESDVTAQWVRPVASPASKHDHDASALYSAGAPTSPSGLDWSTPTSAAPVPIPGATALLATPSGGAEAAGTDADASAASPTVELEVAPPRAPEQAPPVTTTDPGTPGVGPALDTAGDSIEVADDAWDGGQGDDAEVGVAQAEAERSRKAKAGGGATGVPEASGGGARLAVAAAAEHDDATADRPEAGDQQEPRPHDEA